MRGLIKINYNNIKLLEDNEGILIKTDSHLKEFGTAFVYLRKQMDETKFHPFSSFILLFPQ